MKNKITTQIAFSLFLLVALNLISNITVAQTSISCDPNYDCTPGTNCMDLSSCEDTECMKKVVCCHAITQEEFDNMVVHCNGEIPAGAVYVVNTDINFSNVDCSLKKLHIEAKVKECENTQETIALSIIDEPVTLDESTKRRGYVGYSIMYFKGVLHHYPETKELHFYKARRVINGEVIDDVVFKAVGENNVVLYLGDLSDLYP